MHYPCSEAFIVSQLEILCLYATSFTKKPSADEYKTPTLCYPPSGHRIEFAIL